MGSNMLTQEEIDALLNVSLEESNETERVAPTLSATEKDALGEIGNISMGTAATTMSMLLNRRVQITIPRVSITTPGKLAKPVRCPSLLWKWATRKGCKGATCW